jgi:hypothetical protein
MPARSLFAFSLAALLGAPAAATAASDCGPHQHLVVEKDPDEGGTMKRCLCDEGWDADGPAPPCRAARADPRHPAKDGGRKAKEKK